jgi:diacylglycerol O-acyltransferase / wax synthase
VAVVDRLGPQDLMGLSAPAARGWPQDIGALVILDGRGLVDADGRFRLPDVRGHIEQRLHLAPRFRQRVHSPRWGLGGPCWVDAAGFDIRHHVELVEMEAPADEAQLLAACERLRHRQLDEARPLWEMWFLTGLSEGRVGLLIKVSHAIADGASGLALLAAFIDLEVQGPAPTPGPPFVPAPMPTTVVLLADNVRRRLHGAGRVLIRLAHPLDLARDVRRSWPALREAFFDGRAPRTSLNHRPIGSHRVLRAVRADLAAVKRAGRAHGGTVNDVLLAAVTDGLRQLLVDRGEPVRGLVLRAMVPVSLHRDGVEGARGNLDGAMVVPLPVGEPDPTRRLRQIVAATAERKQKARPQGNTLYKLALVRRLMLWLAGRQRFFNVYLANVPGPPVTLFFAGSRIMEILPLVPLTGNLSVGVGALSYDGRLNLTVLGDAELCPDIDVLADGMRASLQALTSDLPAPATPLDAPAV